MSAYWNRMHSVSSITLTTRPRMIRSGSGHLGRFSQILVLGGFHSVPLTYVEAIGSTCFCQRMHPVAPS